MSYATFRLMWSCVGRRVIESYLLLFLNSSSALKATHDLDAILNRTINTYILGEHVGSSWGLGRALRWTPAVPASQVSLTARDSRKLLRGVGFYKVQGDTVAAVVGGIYHQFVSLRSAIVRGRIVERLNRELRLHSVFFIHGYFQNCHLNEVPKAFPMYFVRMHWQYVNAWGALTRNCYPRPQ